MEGYNVLYHHGQVPLKVDNPVPPIIQEVAHYEVRHGQKMQVASGRGWFFIIDDLKYQHNMTNQLKYPDPVRHSVTFLTAVVDKALLHLLVVALQSPH